MRASIDRPRPEEDAPRSTRQVANTGAIPNHPMATRGLSVVLPAWNEEAVIARTVQAVVETLSQVAPDSEVIIVDDGSTDHTGELADGLAAANSRIRVVHHRPNRGYGGALSAGCSAASKELTCFMDADGQLAMRDFPRLLEHIEHYDVVLGYRERRQDPPLRKVNAWGWKLLMRLLFGLNVRAIDCAFKLCPTVLVRQAQVQAQGALVNTELLVKLQRLGCRWIVRARHARPPRQWKSDGRQAGSDSARLRRTPHLLSSDEAPGPLSQILDGGTIHTKTDAMRRRAAPSPA